VETHEAAVSVPPAPGTTDGDASSQVEPREPQDGIIVFGEPTAARDGIADMGRDPRLAEDIAAFTSPPAGYNPYLYQIEPDPLTDRRTRELFYLGPYFARGVRVGSFVIFPEAQIGATATNNIFRNSARLSDGALEVAANVRAVSDWRTRGSPAPAACHLLRSFPQDDRSYAFRRAAGSTSRGARISRCWPCTGLTWPARRLRTGRAAGDVGPIASLSPSTTFNRLPCSSEDRSRCRVRAVGARWCDHRNAARIDWREAGCASWALSSRTDVFAEIASTTAVPARRAAASCALDGER
jgi:hypothetical protein